MEDLMARKLVAADLQAAEIRIFAHYSGDPRLQSVFSKGEDIYSRIAIDVLGRTDLSAHPDDLNFLKKVEPQLRVDFKVVTLACVYGAEGYQIAAGLSLLDERGRPDSKQGDKVIEKYLSTYPNLRKYMIKQELMFKKHGYVKNLFGRVRRFDEAHAIYKKYGDQLLNSMWAKQKGLVMERKIVKKALNAAKNHPIQSVVSSIMNRAIIEIGEWIETNKLDIRVLLCVHDEWILDCDESLTEIAKEKLKYYMENNKFAKQISVPLLTSPIVANNLAEAK
jgi:DNA polymerase-1